MQLKNTLDPAYEKGVKEFLDFAYVNRDPQSKISCPCISCNNFLDQTREVKEDQLFIAELLRLILDGYSMGKTWKIVLVMMIMRLTPTRKFMEILVCMK